MSDRAIAFIAFGIHAIALITAICALAGSFRGRFSRSLFACACASLCYASLICVGSAFDFFSDRDGFEVDLIIWIPLAALAAFAGSASLVRLRRNKSASSQRSNFQRPVNPV